MADQLPCGCPRGSSHSTTALLEAHLELGRVEAVQKRQLDWRERREFLWAFQHQWDISHPGKIDL